MPGKVKTVPRWARGGALQAPPPSLSLPANSCHINWLWSHVPIVAAAEGPWSHLGSTFLPLALKKTYFMPDHSINLTGCTNQWEFSLEWAHRTYLHAGQARWFVMPRMILEGTAIFSHVYTLTLQLDPKPLKGRNLLILFFEMGSHTMLSRLISNSQAQVILPSMPPKLLGS